LGGIPTKEEVPQPKHDICEKNGLITIDVGSFNARNASIYEQKLQSINYVF